MSIPEIEQLLPAITAQIEANMSDWYGATAALQTSPEIQIRDWSFFLRYHLKTNDDQRKVILVKIRRHPDKTIAESINDPGLKAESLNDFNALIAIEKFIQAEEAGSGELSPTPYSAFQGNEKDFYCAIRPLAFINDWSALVMEELEAVQLRKKFLNYKTAYQTAWQDQLVEFCYQSARWLRVYHEQLGRLHAGPFFSEGIYQIFEKNLHYIQSSTHFDLSTLRATLDQTKKITENQILKHGLLHWNFDCANILISNENRVAVLDSHFIEGPIYVDITKIMTDLQTYSYQTLSHGWFINPNLMDRLHTSIVRGYFGVEHFSKQALYLYSIFSVLEKWQSDEEALSEQGKSQTMQQLVIHTSATWRRNYLMKLLNSLTNLLQQSNELDKPS